MGNAALQALLEESCELDGIGAVPAAGPLESTFVHLSNTATAGDDAWSGGEEPEVNPAQRSASLPCESVPRLDALAGHGRVDRSEPALSPEVESLVDRIEAMTGLLYSDVDGIHHLLGNFTATELAALQDPSALSVVRTALRRALSQTLSSDDDHYQALRLLARATADPRARVNETLVDAALERIREQMSVPSLGGHRLANWGNVYLAVTDLNAAERGLLYQHLRDEPFWSSLQADTEGGTSRIEQLCGERDDTRVLRFALVWASQQGGTTARGFAVAGERAQHLLLEERALGRGTASSVVTSVNVLSQLPEAHRLAFLRQTQASPLLLARWTILAEPGEPRLWFDAIRTLSPTDQATLVADPQLAPRVLQSLDATEQARWQAYRKRTTDPSAEDRVRAFEMFDAWQDSDRARVVALYRAMPAATRDAVAERTEMAPVFADAVLHDALASLRAGGSAGPYLYGRVFEADSGDASLAFEALRDPAGVGSRGAAAAEGEPAALRRGFVAEFRQSQGATLTREEQEAFLHYQQRRSELSSIVADRHASEALLLDVMPAPELGAETPGERRFQIDFMAAQVAQVEAHRASVLSVSDAVSWSDDNFRRAVAAFQAKFDALRHASTPSVSIEDYAELASRHARVRETSDAYAASRELVARTASQVAGIVGSIAAIWVTGGAALPYVVVASGLAGAASASVADLVVREQLTSGTLDAALQGGIEGVFGALSGALAARACLGLAAGRAAGDAAVAIGGRAVRRTGLRFLAGTTEGALDGLMGGTAGELFVTARDQATWDQSTYRVLATLLGAAVRGAAVGLGVGGVSGGVFTGLGVTGSALLERLSRTQAERVLQAVQEAGLDPVRLFGNLDETQRSDFVRAIALYEQGLLDEGQAVLDGLPVLSPDQRAALGHVFSTYLSRARTAGRQAVLAHPSDALHAAARWIDPPSGFFDLVVHGTPEHLSLLVDGRWRRFPIEAVPEFLASQGYRGEPIRLVACGAGSDEVAGPLSRLVEADVLAPSDVVWLHPDGRVTVGPDAAHPTGGWRAWRGGRRNHGVRSDDASMVPELSVQAGPATPADLEHRYPSELAANPALQARLNTDPHGVEMELVRMRSRAIGVRMLEYAADEMGYVDLSAAPTPAQLRDGRRQLMAEYELLYFGSSQAKVDEGFRLADNKRFFTGEAGVAELFANRTVQKSAPGARAGGLVVLIPREVMTSLESRRLVVQQPVPDMPYLRETVFEALAVETLSKRAELIEMPPGTLRTW